MEALAWDDFIEKMESEGGIVAMLSWGGPGCFPPEAQGFAREAFAALEDLAELIERHRG